MIAKPFIQTPHGQRAVLIEYGRPAGADKLRSWRSSKTPLSDAMQDALEFGNLAGKRWRYYLRRNEAALSFSAAGIEVFLVNARHVKGVPGRKTDACDAQWLQQLHAAGLVKKSFRPAQDIVPIRFLMRHRSELVGDAAKQLHLMQKTLTELNLKIRHVFSDIDGVSAQAIIDAILAGERDARRLAALRDRRCRSPLGNIIEALNGSYREEYLFVLKQSQQAWRAIGQAIAECDKRPSGERSEHTAARSPQEATQARQERRADQRRRHLRRRMELLRSGPEQLSRVSAGLMSALMSEVGTREHLLGSFRSPAAFASWLGLNPDNRITGGKVLSDKTRKVKCRLAGAFRLAAFGLQHSETQMGHLLRRMKARLGKAEGITATAHKLARVVYGMIKAQKSYDEKEAFKPNPQATARRLKSPAKTSLISRLHSRSGCVTQVKLVGRINASRELATPLSQSLAILRERRQAARHRQRTTNPLLASPRVLR